MKILLTTVGSPGKASLAKAFMDYGFYVVGVDIDPLAVGRFVCDKFYQVHKASEPRFIPELVQICTEHDIDAILPSLEIEARELKEYEHEFKHTKILSPRLNTIDVCNDKLKTHNFLKKIGVNVPDIYDTNTPSDKVFFPVMIKPRDGRGGDGINKALCPVELRHYSKSNCIVEKYISGVEYTIDILSDLNGEPISIIPRTRIDVESGISMKGKTIYDKEIIETCRKIAKELGLVGGSCIQCIKGKEFMFTDINLRFGGGSLLAFKADPMMFKNLERIVMGEKAIKPDGFQEGLTMLRYYAEVYIKE